MLTSFIVFKLHRLQRQKLGLLSHLYQLESKEADLAGLEDATAVVDRANEGDTRGKRDRNILATIRRHNWPAAGIPLVRA